jgi:hypothetical protein
MRWDRRRGRHCDEACTERDGTMAHDSVGLGPQGRLPGDIHIETKNTRFYFPLVTCLLLSLLLSMVLWLVRWLRG